VGLTFKFLLFPLDFKQDSNWSTDFSNNPWYIKWMVFTSETVSVYCALRTICFGYSGYYWGECQASKGLSTAQAVIRRRITPIIWVQSVVGPCEICAGQNGTGTGSSPSASISIIPPLFHSHLYFNTAVSEGQAGVGWEPPNRGMIFQNVRTLERRALPHCLLSGCRRMQQTTLVLSAVSQIASRSPSLISNYNRSHVAALTIKPNSTSVKIG
jgi:hypothetical protein